MNTMALTVMAGLVWGFFCQEGFRIFSPLRCSKGARSGARSRPAPGLRSLGNARRRWPEPCQGRSRRRRGPKARLYEGPAIAENRPPRSVGRLAIARCSTCLPYAFPRRVRARLDFPPFLIRSEASLCRRRPKACKLVSGGAENAPYQEAKCAKRDGEGPRGRDQS